MCGLLCILALAQMVAVVRSVSAYGGWNMEIMDCGTVVGTRRGDGTGTLSTMSTSSGVG
jgi:hypothetical protein